MPLRSVFDAGDIKREFENAGLDPKFVPIIWKHVIQNQKRNGVTTMYSNTLKLLQATMFVLVLLHQTMIVATGGASSVATNWPCCGARSSCLCLRPTFERHLDLTQAYFGGKIPYQLGNLSRLEFLHLPYNYLIGEIPWQLGNLFNLQELMLPFNDLGGVIPYQLDNLSRLENLGLGSNDNLKVDNIQWISHISSLNTLDLSEVSYIRKSKNLLQIIGQLPNLQYLSLSKFALSNMDHLSVHSSQLNFSHSLIQLDLSRNMFTSSIFSWWFHLNSTSLIFGSQLKPLRRFHSRLSKQNN
ncbi:hypothetical protein K1719_044155 [Acacia pycnantha]|nr:hypothetical protein K1719_044155 [Acacia pycnantha]